MVGSGPPPPPGSFTYWDRHCFKSGWMRLLKRLSRIHQQIQDSRAGCAEYFHQHIKDSRAECVEEKLISTGLPADLYSNTYFPVDIFHTLHHSYTATLSHLPTLIVIEGKETCRRYPFVFFTQFIIPSSQTFRH